MTEERKAQQENPGQPGGWAVAPVDTYSPGELQQLEEQKRRDTAKWIDEQNRSPIDNENPAQPGGWGVPPASNAPIHAAVEPVEPVVEEEPVEVVAKVFVSKTAGTITGGKVLLGTSQENHSIGEIKAVVGDQFWVNWRDGKESIEKKADYELVIRDDEEQD